MTDAPMPFRSAQPQGSQKVPPRPLSRLDGERRDAKQESPFYEIGGSVRRSLSQELLADRKR